MPSSTATIPRRTPAALMDDQLGAALAELNWQIEMTLVVELAKLPPGERRLFRAELAPIETHLDGTTSSSNMVTLVAECDPPKMWLVEPGSDDDNLTDGCVRVLSVVNASAEPTKTTLLDQWLVHPQMGIDITYAFGQERVVAGGGRVALECTAPASVNVRGKIDFEE